MRTHEYHDSSITYADGWHGCGNMVKATKALCADGKRRNAHPSNDGIADTFFSIPAYVYATTAEGKKVRVYGYVTIESLEYGFTTDSTDDPITVKFVAYTYRKHHRLVESVEPDPFVPCTPKYLKN